ncbi:MAG: GntR family transcriptional regulator [Bacteroidales bacterium]|nr:GntR family transcriptional regulator [Bacteroidales bacterium]
MELGKINKLYIARFTDNGLYLVNSENEEVLLPNAYVTADLEIGEQMEVFLYTDSEDRIVATTLKPYVQFEEFAYLQVKDANKFGAFMDWGLPKDLMVPFDEQTVKMENDNWYLVFLLLDEETDRLIGSCKINEFVFTDNIDLKEGDEVDLLLYDLTDLGMNAIVNNMYKGLIFESDIHKIVNPGEKIKGFVKKVREDGKLDISLEPIGYKNSIDKNSERILAALKKNEGYIELTDKSNPEKINALVGLSKKAFKRSLGNLYKQKLINITPEGINLLQKD